MVKIGVSGAKGRMGERIIHLAKKDKDFEVVFGLEKKECVQKNEVHEGVPLSDDPTFIKQCDCFIEFTSPLATTEHLSYLIQYKRSVVIGTTGLDSQQQEVLKRAGSEIAIVYSPNMSVGVNLLFGLLHQAAAVLKGYNVSIQEAHHIRKKDAPSGTAKKIAQIINGYGFSIKTEDIKAIREDEIVGDHRVTFESDLDRIELFHSAKTRDIFAQGALLAARWVVDKQPGLYSMKEVLFAE